MKILTLLLACSTYLFLPQNRTQVKPFSYFKPTSLRSEDAFQNKSKALNNENVELLSKLSAPPLVIGGFTQIAENSTTLNWGGGTPSVVMATMTVTENNVNVPVVTTHTHTSPITSHFTGPTLGDFSMTTTSRWIKNSGYMGAGTVVNNYIGNLVLEFSNPVPANEIFIWMMDADGRGIDEVVPDGNILFGLSEATPTDFEQLAWNVGFTTSPALYSASGQITWGIGAATTDANKYVALVGKTTKTVDRIVMFIRNISDAVSFHVGWVTPNQAALPVTLKNFSGYLSASGSVVDLKWDVENEIFFDRYEVERSYDGIQFEKLRSILPNTNSYYTYKDNVAAITASRLYYRLKLIDTDGSFKYSDIVTLNRNLSISETDIKIYPNPIQDAATIEYQTAAFGMLQMNMYNAMGKKMLTRNYNTVPGNNKLNLNNLDNLSAGTYLLDFNQNGRRSKHKISIR